MSPANSTAIIEFMRRDTAQKRRDQGGPINFRGIHYQLVSSFSELGSAVTILDPREGGAELSSVTLVIEPTGGGDSAISVGSRRRIQQIKTSQDNWSLARLVAGPFRDLFRASMNYPEAGVELITNAPLDTQAEFFRQWLEKLAKGDERPFADDQLQWFRHPKRGSATNPGDLVGYLVAQIGLDAALSSQPPTVEEVRSFLRRLSIRAQVPFQNQEEVCRQVLERFGIPSEDLEGTIDRVVGILLRRGYPGNQAMTFSKIAIHLGLARQDLKNWKFLCNLSHERVVLDLTRPRPGYRSENDVRRSDVLTSRLIEILNSTDRSAPQGSLASFSSLNLFRPLVLSGDSGIGKTWLLARAAWQISRLSPDVQLIWLSSVQDPRLDLDALATKFCNQIWGLERRIPLDLLAAKVAGVTVVTPWVIAFIDDVHAPDYLTRLGELQHGELGVQLVVATSVNPDSSFTYAENIDHLRAAGFDPNEVLQFLQKHFPLMRGLPPGDVRKLLENPAFCALYSSVKGVGSGWQPANEYQLVNRLWLERLAGSRPLAADILAELACARMRSAVSQESGASLVEWTIAELRRAGISPDDLEFLERTGILMRDSSSRSFSFVLDRVLQWAAAEGTLRALQAAELEVSELANLCSEILTGDSKARWSFRYVPADLLWLLLDPDFSPTLYLAADAILENLSSHQDFHRLEDWLATLGPRVVPALFRLLRKGSQHAYTCRDVLETIGGDEVGRHATLLLEEKSLDWQEIGVHLLGNQEYPAALDSLWRLHERWSERAKSKDRGEDDPSLRHVVFAEKALRRSVRKQLKWLERKLLEGPLTDSRSTLLYLLAACPGGEEVWRRNKNALRNQLDEKRQRGFVRCIAVFRDSEEIPWLQTKINDAEDFVAPTARGALALLAPDLALSPVSLELELDLAIGRGWWLGPLWTLKPEETARFFVDLILKSKDPSSTAWSFSGFELWWPMQIVDIFFEALRQALSDFRQGLIQPNKDPLYPRLSRLSECRTISQLEYFWQPQHELLAAELADWLIERGPNETRHTRLAETEAMEVLGIFSDSGLGRAGVSLLERAKSWTGGRDGLDLCVRQPSEASTEAIRRKSQEPMISSEGEKPDHPILQRLCTMAMGYLRDFSGFAQGVLTWGLRLPSDLLECLDELRQAPEILEAAQLALRREPLVPGALLLLGIHGSKEARQLLRGLDHRITGDLDLELARIIGFDKSGDSSPAALGLFEQGLQSESEKIAYCSWLALLNRAEEPRVAEVLLASLSIESKVNRNRAGDLLNIRSIRKAAAELIWQTKDVPDFLFSFSSQLHCFAILGTPEVRTEFIQWANMSDSFHPEEARLSAISGLAVLDRDQALLACLALRKEERSSEPEWPSLILEIGGLDGLPHLRDDLVEAKDLIRLHRLGAALRKHGFESVLKEWLGDPDFRVREGACYAACAQVFEASLEAAVIRCCTDPVESVRNAAQTAISYLRKDREVGRILVRFETEEDRARCWALMDSALEMGYPGSGLGPVSWFTKMVRDRPYYERKYCADQLKKRREKWLKGLQSASEDFRSEF